MDLSDIGNTDRESTFHGIVFCKNSQNDTYLYYFTDNVDALSYISAYEALTDSVNDKILLITY